MSGGAHDPRREGAGRPDLRDVERLLSALERPAARPEFRARLRSTFVGEASGPAGSGARTRPDTPAPRELARGKRGTPPPRWRRALAVAAAAAFLLAIPFMRSGEGATWRAVETDAPTRAWVGDRSLDLEDQGAVDRALRAGCRLRTAGGDAFFVRGADLCLRCEPDTLVELLVEEGSGLPLLKLERGAVFVSMRDDLPGPLRIETPFGKVEVEGRAVSIELLEAGLCICCLSGTARLQTAAGSAVVPSGHARLVPRDGGPERQRNEVAHRESVEAALEVASRYVAD